MASKCARRDSRGPMKLAITMVLLCWLPAPARTQTPAQGPAVRTQANVVLVPALVRDSAGEPVFTLTASDFRLTDDGVEQPLALDENAGGEPLALVIAVETGGAGGRKLDAYRDLGGVLTALVGGAPLEIAVVGFDSSPSLLLPFTSSVDAAAQALRDLEPGDHQAAILDALSFSVDRLRSAPPGYRRAILLLSETVDHGSKTRLADVLRSVSDTNTAIYAAAFSSVKSYSQYQTGEIMYDGHPGPAHGCFAKDPSAEADEVSTNRWMQAFDCLGVLAPPLRAAKIAVLSTAYGMERKTAETGAELTGGEYFRFNDARSLERDLMTLTNHLPNRYALSFRPQSLRPGFHSIELWLKDYPSLHVSARRGYWVDEETSARGK
jgi:VWFA-related protein